MNVMAKNVECSCDGWRDLALAGVVLLGSCTRIDLEVLWRRGIQNI